MKEEQISATSIGIVATSYILTLLQLQIPVIQSSHLLPNSLVESTSSTDTFNYIVNIDRIIAIKSVRGKYSFVKTSSDEFARRKHQEIEIES